MARKSIVEQRIGFKPKRSIVETTIMADQPVTDWKAVADKTRLSPAYRSARDALSKIDVGGVVPALDDPVIVIKGTNRVINNRASLLAAFDLDIQRAEVLLVDSDEETAVHAWLARNRRKPEETVDYYLTLYDDDD